MSKTLALRSHHIGSCCLLLLLMCFSTAYALDPAWLDELPDLKRLTVDMDSGDRFEDLARQTGAVRQLREAINIMAGQRRWDNQLTVDEKRLINSYWEAENILVEQGKSLPPRRKPGKYEGPSTEWMLLATHYEVDDQLRAEVAGRYFSPDTLRQLGYADAAHAAMAARGGAELNQGVGMKPKSRWQKQTDEQKAETVLIAALLIILTLPSLYRETRRFGIVPNDPRQMQAGFRRFKLHWFSGAVANYSKSTEVMTTTTTTSYNDGSRSWKQNVTKTTYESFDLIAGNDKQTIFLTNANVNMTNGNLVTAVWAIRKKKDEGPYILFLDRTMGVSIPVKNTLWSIFKVRYWIMAPLLLLFSWLAVTTEIFEFGGRSGLSAMGQAFAAPFVGWVLLLVLFFWIAGRRTRKFNKRDSKEILAAVLAEEGGVSRAG